MTRTTNADGSGVVEHEKQLVNYEHDQRAVVPAAGGGSEEEVVIQSKDPIESEDGSRMVEPTAADGNNGQQMGGQINVDRVTSSGNNVRVKSGQSVNVNSGSSNVRVNGQPVQGGGSGGGGGYGGTGGAPVVNSVNQGNQVRGFSPSSPEIVSSSFSSSFPHLSARKGKGGEEGEASTTETATEAGV